MQERTNTKHRRPSAETAHVISPACGTIGPFALDKAIEWAKEISGDNPDSFAKVVCDSLELGYIDGRTAVLENGEWKPRPK